MWCNIPDTLLRGEKNRMNYVTFPEREKRLFYAKEEMPEG